MYIMITLAFCYIAVDVNHEYVSSGYLVIYKRGFAGLDNNGGGLMIAMSVPLAYFAWEATRGFSSLVLHPCDTVDDPCSRE